MRTDHASFPRGLISSLPPIHELAKQAGITLPSALGKVDDGDQAGQKSGK